MGIYKYLQQAWKKPKDNKELWKARLIQYREEPATIRVDGPTRLDRARALGYKAKKGVLIVRQRVPKGGHRRRDVAGGRRPKHFRHTMVLSKNYQVIAEERANKKYPNCEVLNSYYVAEDGQSRWFEVIMIDPLEPNIISDPKYNFLVYKKGRTYRGLTSSGRKMRGLRNKGKGAEKVRPSSSAQKNRIH